MLRSNENDERLHLPRPFSFILNLQMLQMLRNNQIAMRWSDAFSIFCWIFPLWGKSLFLEKFKLDAFQGRAVSFFAIYIVDVDAKAKIAKY